MDELKKGATQTQSRPYQPALYFKSGESEAPSFIMTEAVFSHNSGVHTVAQGASVHVLPMAQRLITHRVGECIFITEKHSQAQTLKAGELKQHKCRKQNCCRIVFSLKYSADETMKRIAAHTTHYECFRCKRNYLNINT